MYCYYCVTMYLRSRSGLSCSRTQTGRLGFEPGGQISCTLHLYAITFSYELVNVAREREVWVPLLELLPPTTRPLTSV